MKVRQKKKNARKLRYQVVLGQPIKTMYDRREVKPHLFCPFCGETRYNGSGNKAEYPEHWEYFYCANPKCMKVVGYIDNSPFIHALECAEDNFDPIF